MFKVEKGRAFEHFPKYYDVIKVFESHWALTFQTFVVASAVEKLESFHRCDTHDRQNKHEQSTQKMFEQTRESKRVSDFAFPGY